MKNKSEAKRKITIELTPEEFDTFQDAAEFTRHDIAEYNKGFAIVEASV